MSDHSIQRVLRLWLPAAVAATAMLFTACDGSDPGAWHRRKAAHPDDVTDDAWVYLNSNLVMNKRTAKGLPATRNSDLAVLPKHPRLKYLALNDTQITDAGLTYLSRLKQLEELSLADTQVGDAGLRHLRNLKSLKILNVQDTRVTDAGLQELLQHLEGVQVRR